MCYRGLPGNFDDRFIERHLIGRRLEDVSRLLGFQPVAVQHDQAVYILRRYVFGLFSKRLYVYLQDDCIVDFYIGML